jgi:hypothetical protein
VLVMQVYEGFERTPVDRPSKRWVIVAAGDTPDDTVEPAVAVEAEGRNPAA